MMLAGVVVLSGPVAAIAESLAGSAGQVRHRPRFMDSEGVCQDVYKAYVEASGHSAYAQTHLSFNVEAFFCGHSFNAPSQKVAEERALENCNAAFKYYKLSSAGRCTIYASK
ncbi:hypothetical protein [Neoaquamicrobium sediminum]|uniref:hypothetical protein n=1 Tax=Neoaquamicrobium sediminum TaxID=1849104 RepID=UPI00360CFB30